MYRPTWAEIDLDALVSNLRYAEQSVHPKKIIPVIKADAYGHGAIEVMKHLEKKGINLFAVSLLEEALALREVSDTSDILMMGPLLSDQFEICQKHRIQFTVYDETIAKEVLTYPKPLAFHLKVDTGMHRYGLEDEDMIISWMKDIHQSPHDLVGIYTHFATANSQDQLFHEQVSKMEALIKKLPYLPRVVHVSNSSASLRYESHITYTTHTRLGISLYGLSLDQDQLGLTPVMKLKSKVVEIKRLKAGETVGYGGSYRAYEDEEWIAILPIGYADGWIRRNKTGKVEINGELYPMVGIICMDACFVRVDQSVRVGDTVTLFGGKISLDDVAKRLSTISYEVVCGMSKRIPRIYQREE
jgi:alanine racemase